MTKRIYFAAPLFALSERWFNKKIVDEEIRSKLGDKYTVYLPQENTSINDKTKPASSVEIFYADEAELIKSDVLVCFLDGVTVDSGVASEVGWYAAMIGAYNHYKDTIGSDGFLKDRKIIGVITDSREGYNTFSIEKAEMMKKALGESQFFYINLFTSGAVNARGKSVDSIEAIIEALDHLEFTE